MRTINLTLLISTLALLLLIAASILMSTGLWLNSETTANAGMACLAAAFLTALTLMRGSR